jgi:hypothetical protein
MSHDRRTAVAEVPVTRSANRRRWTSALVVATLAAAGAAALAATAPTATRSDPLDLPRVVTLRALPALPTASASGASAMTPAAPATSATAPSTAPSVVDTRTAGDAHTQTGAAGTTTRRTESTIAKPRTAAPPAPRAPAPSAEPREGDREDRLEPSDDHEREVVTPDVREHDEAYERED